MLQQHERGLRLLPRERHDVGEDLFQGECEEPDHTPLEAGHAHEIVDSHPEPCDRVLSLQERVVRQWLGLVEPLPEVVARNGNGQPPPHGLEDAPHPARSLDRVDIDAVEELEESISAAGYHRAASAPRRARDELGRLG